MEFHVIKKAGSHGEADQTAHIMTTQGRDEQDQSPLQLISAELLAHYKRCEAELAAIKAR